MVKRISIGVISEKVYEPSFLSSIMNISRTKGIEVDVDYYFIHDEELFERVKKLEFILIWLNLEESYRDLANISDNKTCYEHMVEIISQKYVDTLRRIRDNVKCQIYFMSLEDYYLPIKYTFANLVTRYDIADRINTVLYDMFKDKIYFIDTKRVICDLGIDNSYCEKNRYRWGNPYSSRFTYEIAKTFFKHIENNIFSQKKCLILDCDNVLWGGDISELGIEGIQLGENGISRKYLDFQSMIVNMYYKGVIIAVCSKNDYNDVINVFKNHSSMLLKEEMVSIFMVNFKPKYLNIIEIAENLKLSLESFVFVDDSEYEINSIKKKLPEVKSFLYDTNLKFSKDMEVFILDSECSFEETKIRNETYKSNIYRKKYLDESIDIDDYNEKLGTKIIVKKSDESEYKRISDLTKRANRNTNGKRFTYEDLLNSNSDIISVKVSDIFGNLGLVGSIVVKENNVELFVVSCRVQGRKVEDYMVNYLNSNYGNLDLSYENTGKNREFVNKILYLLNKREG